MERPLSRLRYRMLAIPSNRDDFVLVLQPVTADAIVVYVPSPSAAARTSTAKIMSFTATGSRGSVLATAGGEIGSKLAAVPLVPKQTSAYDDAETHHKRKVLDADLHELWLNVVE